MEAVATSRPIVWNLSKIIELPANTRRFYGHLKELIDTTYNSAYVAPWAQHFGQLAGQDFSGAIGWIQSRANYVMGQLNSLAPQVPFGLTTVGPLDVGSAETAIVQGKGWIDVHEIRLSGTDDPLDAVWTIGSGASYAESWQVDLPLQFGSQVYTFEGYDFHGNLIGSESIQITTTAANPALESLRITEINYNPGDPTAGELAVNPNLDNDDFEFVGLQNIWHTSDQFAWNAIWSGCYV